MSAFLIANFVPILFGGLLLFLLSGIPVAFALAATGLYFGLLGDALGLFSTSLFQALPLRLFGIMKNDTLLAVPFFTFMGIVLQRSGMAEDLLENIGQVFGRVRGGIAIAVVVVGALLAATTGVVSAAVISMGLISLPVMMRYGYSRTLATGVISASGTLAQIVPPSLVLIVMADQLGQPVGDMYSGAFTPSLALVGLYLAFIVLLAVIRPAWVPALPSSVLIHEDDGHSTGHRSLALVFVISLASGYLFGANYDALGFSATGSDVAASEEKIIFSILFGALVAFCLVALNRGLKLHLLSKLTEQVTFALIPPLILIFLVLGTIFLGIATPTEGGAMGATGAVIMAMSRKRLTWKVLNGALNTTTLLTCFVMFIVIGATVFSFSFNAVDGSHWVANLFENIPGAEIGFLLIVNALIFFLGMFIDYFEIAFIVIPILMPVAEQMDINLVWFGVLIAMSLQASFLTPPFGYALFYLRSVAPVNSYIDKTTHKRVDGVSTMQIYKGSIFFILIQMVMVAVIMIYPGIVTNSLHETHVDLDSVQINIDTSAY